VNYRQPREAEGETEIEMERLFLAAATGAG
jgi:hypothetical protein